MPGIFDMFDEGIVSSHEETGYSKPSSQQGRTFVISVGGSVFFGPKPNHELIKAFASAIEELLSEGYKFAIVVGGGANARNYCEAAKHLGMNNFYTDLAAIKITEANALLIAGSLKNSVLCINSSLEKAKRVVEYGKIPVYGGIIPSFTTDSVAALIAESMNATFINLTNVDGIYSTDPSKSNDAKLYSKLDYETLLELLKDATSKPGQNFVLDLPCALILRRSSIRAVVLKGDDFENLKSFIRGYSFKGSLVEENAAEMFANSESLDSEVPETRRPARHTSRRRRQKSSNELRPEDIDF